MQTEQIDTAAIEQPVIQCSCTVRERDSGHRTDCAYATETKPDTFEQIQNLFRSLQEEIRAMSPCNDGYLAISVSRSGFKEYSRSRDLRVYFGEGYAFSAGSMDDLRQQIKAANPESVKQAKIADLEAQLAALKGGAK